MTTPHDPATDPEDEGIPDLQDGSPEQQEASDPQQLPVAGDEPTIAEFRETTPNEAREGETLDERLSDEEPEPDPAELARPGQGTTWEDPEPDEPQPDEGDRADERAGLLYDEPDPDRPREQDVYSQEGTTRGLSAEEEAVHIRDDDRL
ncbi:MULTISPECIES: DUF5709 domain-containing protein [Streptomyces]|uniref:DUF5709 domain-containing protein n=1 Tax=Streptomyces lycii TaxID=2654337 RepID=A0ABQ7FR34_9ACTN|nr:MULTISPECIES: DUF5709 domain-containing protein [Streptomyces]KAF4409837.1 hypothetical protein GCU69_06955 [Streptomyces lycii]PGH47444.1 hypothetical protein CRI70_28465 [Streptomyces sp. Ru87]